jgi:hypothetical protein
MTRLNAGVALVTAIVAAAALSISAAPAGALGGANKSCGTIVAAKWQTGGKMGKTWVVTAAKSTSCAVAKHDGSKLTHEKVSKIGEITPAPSGFGCGGTPIGGAPLEISCSQTSGSGGFTVTASGYKI